MIYGRTGARSTVFALTGTREGWSLRIRVPVAVGVLLLFTAAATAPGIDQWISSRARYTADLPDPQYDVSIDRDSLHRAGDILRRVGGTYFVYVPAGSPVLLGNIGGALRLWAVPAVPVAYSNDHPDWVFSYHTPLLLPPGLHAARVYPVGAGVRLVKVAR
jgi:hypothetical protein